MRTRTIGTGLLLGMSAAMLSAPLAAATPDPVTGSTGGEIFIVADGSPQAGENIEVVVRCAGEVGAPGSPVLQIGDLGPIDSPAQIPTYSAPAAILDGTAPGDYPLVASCDGHTLSASFVVQPPDPSGGEVFIVADGSPQAGEHVEVGVRCHGEVGSVESSVLQIGELSEVDTPADIPTYVGPATIDRDAAPGDYPLTASCDDLLLSTTLTIYPSDGDGGDDGGNGDQVIRTPRGAPDTGGGDPGTDPTELLLGLLGVVGLSGLGVLTLRHAVWPGR